MQCLEARELLSEQLDGRLSTDELHTLQEHLAECESCRVEQELLRRAHALFSQVEFAAPPAALAGQVMTRIRRRRVWLRTVRGAAYLVLALTIFAATCGVTFASLVAAVGPFAGESSAIGAVVDVVLHVASVLNTVLGAVAVLIRAAVSNTNPFLWAAYAGAAAVILLVWTRLAVRPAQSPAP